MTHVELAATTNFTFLTGASHPEEMVERAAELGLSAIAITDRNSLAGVVRAHVRLRELRRQTSGIGPRNITGADVREHAARIRSQTRVDPSSRLTEAQLRARFTQKEQVPPVARPSELPEEIQPLALPKLIVGARLVLTDTPVEIVALAPDRTAYAALCRLLTTGKRRAVKGECRLTLDDVAGAEGLILIACPPDPLPAVSHPTPGEEAARGGLRALAGRLAGLHLALTPAWDGRDEQRFEITRRLASELGLPTVAVTAPLMHAAERRQVADVLTCIREGCTIDALGHRALPNAERRLRSPAELDLIYAGHGQALANAAEIADALHLLARRAALSVPRRGPGRAAAGAPRPPRTRGSGLALSGRRAYPRP